MEIDAQCISDGMKQLKDLDPGMPFVWSGNLYIKARACGVLLDRLFNKVQPDEVFCVNVNTGGIIMASRDTKVFPKRLKVVEK